MANKLEISANVGKADIFTALQFQFYTAIALKDWRVTAQIQTQTALTTVNRSCCTYYHGLAGEMLDTETGLQAFVAGDYATTVAHLLKTGHFIDVSQITITALTTLAKSAWEHNDYARAQAMAKNALLVARNGVTIVLLYNAAIADWQYRHSHLQATNSTRDNLTWQFLAAQVLKQQAKISPAHRDIIAILTAMQQGMVIRKPEFISQ